MNKLKVFESLLIYTIFVLSVYWSFSQTGLAHGAAQSISADEDLSLSKEEKVALDKFKQRVVSLVPHTYMKQDVYLIRWLRVQNLNLKAAEEMLKNNLKWRHEQRMDSVSLENWSDMEADFPYSNDGFDKVGRPIGTVSIGSWDVRRMALAGKMPRMQRYLTKLLEEITQRVIEQQKQGKKVTRWTVLVDLDGFSEIQHACVTCLPLWSNFIRTIQDRYPGMANSVVFINMPVIFSIVTEFMNPILSARARRVGTFFGTDKSEWMNFLDKEISREQRRIEFGGTMKD